MCVCKLFWRLQLKSVQTSAVVCTDYTCSLHRLRRVLNLSMRKYEFIYVYLLKCLRVLNSCKCAYLRQRVRRTHDCTFIIEGLVFMQVKEPCKGDTPAKPRVARAPKARTEPWVYTNNK